MTITPSPGFTPEELTPEKRKERPVKSIEPLPVATTLLPTWVTSMTKPASARLPKLASASVAVIAIDRLKFMTRSPPEEWDV